jgi:peptidoglycan/LPS O-acetylase OafA/YrhL
MLLPMRRVLVAIFGASIAMSLLYLHFGWQSPKSLPTTLLGYPQEWARFVPMYLAGVLFYLYRSSIRLHVRGAMISIFALAAACVVPFGYSLLFPVFGTYLLMYVAYWERLPLYRVMRFGDFSYGAYLYAFPIQQLLVQHFALRSALRLFAATTPLVLLAATISWFAIEQPALDLVKRRRRPLKVVPVLSIGNISPAAVE